MQLSYFFLKYDLILLILLWFEILLGILPKESSSIIYAKIPLKNLLQSMLNSIQTFFILINLYNKNNNKNFLEKLLIINIIVNPEMANIIVNTGPDNNPNLF
jgi:hypothetical protein